MSADYLTLSADQWDAWGVLLKVCSFMKVTDLRKWRLIKGINLLKVSLAFAFLRMMELIRIDPRVLMSTNCLRIKDMF
jgi:hypothetical protein